MQQPRDPPDLDLGRLPEPVRRAVAAAQREVAAAQAAADTSHHEPAAPATQSVGDRLDDHTLLEVEAARQRQLQQAFARGRTAGPAQGSSASWGLWAGLAIAVALALAVGLVAIIQATLAHHP
jgi:hypothetical protein